MKGPQHAGTPLSTLLLAVANVLIPVSIVVFATGFFPYKPLLPGLAQYDVSKDGSPPPAPFDRVVFMVVDALRSDFVYSDQSGFEYTQSLIRDGGAIPFTAHATSPTVTMPRIKAITTGSIPSFLDVILNIDEGDESSSLASQDTWLAQMKAKNTGKLVLYGDDTWLKLFPDTFDRADGTSSFFVADFTEVDNNVTRHVTDELKKDDWNTLVLHYLGLDHIGHKGGPRSSNMIPKQREMDDIVKEIYEAIEEYDHLHSTLLILCGDHGMNDGGNHGGSSAGETSPALVFLSPKMKSLSRTFRSPAEFKDDFQYYATVEQSDLAPTLGALLGFPVPKNNLGAMVVDFLPFWPKRHDQALILKRNANQILDIITAAFGSDVLDTAQISASCSSPGTEVQDLACRWHKLRMASEPGGDSEEAHALWTSQMSEWLRDAQSLMSSMASNYDMPRLVLGQLAAWLSVACAVASVYACFGEIPHSSLPFALITLGYGVMMFASSYVEEEHHFWYWSSTAWLAFISYKGLNRTTTATVSHISAVLTAFIATRIIRAWNQTGQKFAGGPDIVKGFLQPHPIVIWVLLSVSYLWIHRELIRGFDGLPTALGISGATGLALAGFTFKLAFTNEDAPELVVGFAQSMVEVTKGVPLVFRAQAVFIGLGLGVACTVYYMVTKSRISKKATAIETLHLLYTLLAMTQSRTTNIPLFLLFDVVYKFLAAQNLTLAELSTTSLLLQYASFFAFGGTNAISSVDLSNAYNGVSDFNVAAVGILTFVSNWAAPIYWTSAMNVLLVRKAKAGERHVYKTHVAVLTVFVAASTAFVMAACTVLRTHLFIWTVFSPKYLYCMAWSLGQHLAVNVALGGLLFWLGTY
ncbi:GPI ethanolamine phosphate transferase 2 [Pleurostoma richardsiae]|uniref:GPI ethanolamine phosphate transferase 2 n=1 Tax=Pleurostoma richardsiae TaxID=41990 RepID=A0AA38RL53_9PEZI|nr:GPI ethanolamine phosphate transferase 2 [Pleurostoma richardsiae]